MIVGVGIDIIEVERVLGKVDKGQGFKEKIFTPGEIEYCESRVNRGEHYAARFAVKEAFLKAAGIGLTKGYSLHEIEVVAADSGKPMIVLHGNYKALSEKNSWTSIHVSISHIKLTAAAIVILEQ